MAKDDPRNTLGAARKEGAEPAEERMEDWFKDTTTTSEFEEGEVVRGRVVHLGSSEVLVDVGYKSEGAIPIDEFRGNLPKVGDEIEVYLEAKEDSEGLIVLSKDKADKIKVWDVVTQAFERGAPVEGRVIEVVKGGLSVDVGVKAFLPGSQVDLRPVKNLTAMVGQQIRAKVIKLNRRRGNVVLSRRTLLEEEREEKKKHTLEVLAEGMALTGTVKNITDYGAFIDLGGIDGLLHVTDMSWGRVGHPSEIFQVGDQVEVVVLHFDRETGRVSLGYKQKSSDPWAVVDERYPVGAKAQGRVVSLTNYGAFVELEPGVEGLAHASTFAPTGRADGWSRLVAPGMTAAFEILSIDPEKKRIGVALVPDDSARAGGTAPSTLAIVPGARLTGKVERHEKFGVFVFLAPGRTGLIPVSETGVARESDVAKAFPIGADVEVAVLEVDPAGRRIRLSVKAILDAKEKDEMREYAERQDAAPAEGFGSLADKLRGALKPREK